MMNKLNSISLYTSYAIIAFLSTAKVNAQIFGPPPDIGGVDATDTDSVRTEVVRILQIVLSFMALVAVIFIVIAGIRLIASQGEEQEKDKAKKTIFYVIIGLIVILLAKAIVAFVEDVFVT